MAVHHARARPAHGLGHRGGDLPRHGVGRGVSDPSSPVAELVVVAASIAALVAVGFALVRAGQTTGSTKALLIGLDAVSVVVSWLVVHTVYMLRYARNYYTEPAGGIGFNPQDLPAYLDFAYFSFTIGMTFQVSDTNITRNGFGREFEHQVLSSSGTKTARRGPSLVS
jgi:uncharacterized membrane protein